MSRTALRLTTAIAVLLLSVSATNAQFSPVAPVNPADARQEAGGTAEVSLQSYFLGGNTLQLSSLAGSAISFRQFWPGPGMITGNFEGYMDSTKGRIGNNFVTFNSLRWKSRVWKVTAGDFRVRSQMVPAPFSNYTYPELGVRGVNVEMTDGVRHYRFFAGEETLQQGPRIAFRVGVPQFAMGAEVTQSFGSKLQVGVRYWDLSSSEQKVIDTPAFFPAGSEYKRGDTATVQSRYLLRPNISLFAEGDLSLASRPAAFGPQANVPFSWITGVMWQRKKFTVRANYGSLSRSVMPAIGHYIGDRKGPFAEVKYSPLKSVELYATALESSNNLEHNPNLPDYKTRDASAGIGLNLPARFSVSGSYSIVTLTAKQASDPSQNQKQNSRQSQLSLAHPIGKHYNLTILYRDLDLQSTLFSQRQRSAEVLNNVQFSRFGFGFAARGQQAVSAGQMQNSVFYRGNGQLRVGRLTLFAQFEAGNDLVNKTLFAVSTVSNTVAGMSFNIFRGWTMNAEVFRSNLIANLNPYSIFVLQSRGTGVSETISDFNQWSFFARFSHKVKWGAMLPEESPTGVYAADQVYGSIEGSVLESATTGVPGVSVKLDGSRTAVSDASGRYRFENVGGGPHKVELNLDELPAEFTPGKSEGAITVDVQPRKFTRLDFRVLRTTAGIRGTIKGLAKEDAGSVHLDRIIINLGPGDRYTTCDQDCEFGFFNLTAGVYKVSVDIATLPENYVLVSPAEMTVDLSGNAPSIPVRFVMEKRVKQLKVRKVFEGKAPTP